MAVKLPQAITHGQRLRQPRVVDPLLDRFFDETSGLGPKRGPVLVQLPPSLEFDLRITGRFFRSLRSRYDGALVCEPRHPTWFSAKAEGLLIAHEIARVAADPVRAPGADRPGGWPGIVYYRLHGSPRTYWSSYDDSALVALAEAIRVFPPTVAVWVVFDNTASGAAMENALALTDILSAGSGRSLHPVRLGTRGDRGAAQ